MISSLLFPLLGKKREQTNHSDLESRAADSTNSTTPQSQSQSPQFSQKMSKFFRTSSVPLSSSAIDVGELPSWASAAATYLKSSKYEAPAPDVVTRFQNEYTANDDFNKMVKLWVGDMTKLKIDAITNAANSQLAAGGGVCGAIFKAAGHRMLEKACDEIGRCEAGKTVATSGFQLHAKYIFHTVGPTNKERETLANCYRTCLDLAIEKDLRSIAFCCIATGIYGFPNTEASIVALQETREYLQRFATKDPSKLPFDSIVFTLFTELDIKLYHQNIQVFFPITSSREVEKKE